MPDRAHFFHYACEEGSDGVKVGIGFGFFGFGVVSGEEEREGSGFKIEGVFQVGIGRGIEEVGDFGFWEGGV